MPADDLALLGARSSAATVMNKLGPHVCLAIQGLADLPPSGAYMRQGTESALVQLMACRLSGTKPLPEPMLIYCQLVLENKLQWNSNQITKLFIHKNVFKNTVCEMAAILFRGRWVTGEVCRVAV